MAYIPNPPWIDFPSTETLITAGALNHLENGLLAASIDADLALSQIAPQSFSWSSSGSAALTTGGHRLYNDTGGTRTITAVRASVGTAPTGSALIVDVNKNGTTIFTTQTNRPTIPAGSFTDTADTVQVATWPPGEYLTVDIDQVGSTIPGSNLTVTVVAT